MLLHGIKKLLNIPGYKITDTSFTDGEIHIYLEPYKKGKPICSQCSEAHTKGYHNSQLARAEDLSISGRRVYLIYTREDIDAPMMERSIPRIYHGSKSGRVSL